MKKLLTNILSFSLLTITLSNVVACTGYDFNGGNVNPTPPKPTPKDVNYYQNLIKNCQSTINDFINNINELAKYQNDKDIFPTSADYIRTIAELKAEQASYQVTVYDSQYQILYIQTNGSFNSTEKSQAIIYLQQKLIQLNYEFTIKKQYSVDYDKSELANITEQITNTQTILNNLLKP